MPGNLAQANPVGVLPKMLYTSFSENRSFPVMTQGYHDATSERYMIQDGVNPPESIRTWKLSVRLRYADLFTLRDFYTSHNGGVIPFYFYQPYEQNPGSPVGSNFDPIGDNEQGRHIVRFITPSWTEVTAISLTSVSFDLYECA